MFSIVAPLLCGVIHYPSTSTLFPLVEVWDCRDLPSYAACGPAAPQRTDGLSLGGVWQQRFLQATSNFSTVANELTASLRGAVLDIVLVPSEDDAFIAVSLAGETYIGGLVGEVIGLLAGDGGFTWRAIVVNPPGVDGERAHTYATRSPCLLTHGGPLPRRSVQQQLGFVGSRLGATRRWVCPRALARVSDAAPCPPAYAQRTQRMRGLLVGVCDACNGGVTVPRERIYVYPRAKNASHATDAVH